MTLFSFSKLLYGIHKIETVVKQHAASAVAAILSEVLHHYSSEKIQFSSLATCNEVQ